MIVPEWCEAYCPGLLTDGEVCAGVGTGAGAGRCLARRKATSWATSSWESDSLKLGIFWPPFSIWAEICAAFMVLRTLARDGPFWVPWPVAPWQ